MTAPPDVPAPGTGYLRLVLDADLRLLTVAGQLRQHWGAHAASIGLSGAQAKVLLSLAPREEIPMRRLAERLDYDASNLTGVVDRLQRRGAIERSQGPADRRVKTLRLTPAGERLREQFWRGLTEDPGPLAPLAEADLRELTRLLALLDPGG
ncbi:MAG TPA: MarR family transcriptional regulator [Streptosporangiaceae bacterium]|jgi:DNA-binding MarR family transcriptional regulator|nr:MarR family transcriptional regulator [Streptosporangiaceae bacterium]